MIEETFFTRNPLNQRVVGLINHKKPKEATPALILAHGFKGSKEQRYLEYLARHLCEDFVVIRFDFTNGVGESDGDIFNITVGHYVEDLKTVISFAKNELYYVDGKKIALFGANLGGDGLGPCSRGR